MIKLLFNIVTIGFYYAVYYETHISMTKYETENPLYDLWNMKNPKREIKRIGYKELIKKAKKVNWKLDDCYENSLFDENETFPNVNKIHASMFIIDNVLYVLESAYDLFKMNQWVKMKCNELKENS